MAGAIEDNHYKEQEAKQISRYLKNRSEPSHAPISNTQAKADSATTKETYSLDNWQKDMQKQFNPDAPLINQQSIARVEPVANPAAQTLPYNSIGEAVKPLSDKALKNIVEPTAKNLKTAAKNKQPHVATPETDLVGTIGAVQDGLGNVYAKENLMNVTDSIHQGKTDGQEKHYANPPNVMADDFPASIHAGDTLGHQTDMANPDPDALKGFETTYRGIKVNWVALRQMGNKIFDPEGKHLDTKELDKWLRDEEAYLANTKMPELVDFTKLDWKNNPDKVIELGGQYFRQSLLGTYAFGYAADVIKGRAGPVANQIIGTMTGIARIYCQKDDLLQAAIRGTAGSSAQGWDFLMERATAHLPITSRQAVRFLNHVMTKDAKEAMFKMVTADMKVDKGDGEKSRVSTGNGNAIRSPLLERKTTLDPNY